MIIYNVTVKVDHSIADDWLSWLQQEHIPDIIATECFTNARILRLLEVDESDGITYAVQYHANSKALYNRYIKEYSTEMRNKSTEKWGDKFVAFRSVMQIVH
ncbi:MAG TPA: DUF4286 family protein [Chitinophagaceae bacterium]|nr:DUF4286 family protein [Chitinophagaceae bacterium]HRG92620.1 DUF4286 family protein [Chitinophagaceae bacterium]